QAALRGVRGEGVHDRVEEEGAVRARQGAHLREPPHVHRSRQGAAAHRQAHRAHPGRRRKGLRRAGEELHLGSEQRPDARSHRRHHRIDDPRRQHRQGQGAGLRRGGRSLDRRRGTEGRRALERPRLHWQVSSGVAHPSAARSAAAGTAPRPGLWQRPHVYRYGSLAVVLGLWELLGPKVDPLFFTYPSAIARAFWTLTVNGELAKYSAESLQILLYGMLLAIAVGIPLGVVMGRVRQVDWTLDTYVNALYSTPMVALVPVLVLWLGIRMEAKVTVV